MVTKEDIERFLDRLAADEGGTYSEVESGLWIARPSGELDFSVVIHYSPPVVLLPDGADWVVAGHVFVVDASQPARRGGDPRLGVSR